MPEFQFSDGVNCREPRSQLKELVENSVPVRRVGRISVERFTRIPAVAAPLTRGLFINELKVPLFLREAHAPRAIGGLRGIGKSATLNTYFGSAKPYRNVSAVRISFKRSSLT